MKYTLGMIIYLMLAQSAMAFCVSPQDYTPLHTRYDRGLLFATRDCANNSNKTHFVFGTYHSDKQAIINTARTAFASLKHVKAATFEIKSDAQMQAKTLNAIMLPASSTGLQELIGETLYTKLETASKTHGTIPTQMLPRLNIWAAAILLQYPKAESSGLVLDMALQQQAEKMGLEIAGLETIDEQFSIFQNLTPAQQLYFLEHTLDSLNELDTMLEKITTHYIAQDLNQIELLSREAFDALPDRTLATYLERTLVTERNKRMTQRMIPLFNKQSTLVAVGALHLPSDTGILSLLEQQGFQVQPVPVTP